jgi:hypothetical protein
MLLQTSGMVLGSMRIAVRPLSQQYPQPPLAPTQHLLPRQDDHHRLSWAHSPSSQRLSYDSFSPHSADVESATDRLANSRLNADSSPFIPTFSHQDPRSGPQALKISTPPPPRLDPKSSPSAGHSSDTRVSTSSGSSGTHGSHDSKISKTQSAAETVSSDQVGMGSVPIANSRMHDRWLRAGMGKEDKWFKSAAWCELEFSE